MIKTKGTCEICDKPDIQLFQVHGNMVVCVDCKAIEDEAAKQMKSADAMIQQTRAVDSSIVLKSDVFLAHTVALVELQAAIENDESIPSDQKHYKLADASFEHFLHMKKVVFEKRAELLEAENEMRMWQVATQTSAGKLRADQRAKFKELDINYAPVTPKTVKPKTVKPKKSFDKAALYEAAKKYGVPAAQVQSIVVSRNMTPEDAAKTLAALMGVTK